MTLDRNHGRVFVGVDDRAELIILQAEPQECNPVRDGLGWFYPADGVFEDVADQATLNPSGGVSFAPGRVGQAFVFDGAGASLAGPSHSHYNFGTWDFSIAFYVKFAEMAKEMTLFDRTSTTTRVRARLGVGADRRLSFEFANARTDQVRLRGATDMVGGRWYHICATKRDVEIVLYVDGIAEGSQRLPTPQTDSRPLEDIPLHFGSTGDGRNFLRGKLDEIVYYERALSGSEVAPVIRFARVGRLCNRPHKPLKQ